MKSLGEHLGVKILNRKMKFALEKAAVVAMAISYNWLYMYMYIYIYGIIDSVNGVVSTFSW